MINLIKIAIRNLLRYKRRAILTSLLIVIGVILVVVSSGVIAGFKYSATGMLTDTMLSHIQVHKKGYFEVYNTSPLNIYLNDKEMQDLAHTLDADKNIEVYSPRINFMAMASIYSDTTTMKITAVDPEHEAIACPAIADRFKGVEDKQHFLKPGEIIIPESIAKVFNLQTGGTIVLVATNRSGSMNGMVFKVAGILESLGSSEFLRNGYIHISDAQSLLQMETPEISEVAIRLRDINTLGTVYPGLKSGANGRTALDSSIYEVHSWENLTPFTSIIVLMDIVTNVIKFILFAIVLISILNIMMMAVYERTKEIGTISAMGTPGRRIRGIFLVEGGALGLFSLVAGLLFGLLLLAILSILGITLKAGPFVIRLIPIVSVADMISVSVLVLIVSILASLWPAFKASRLNPVDALGHV
jgi:putative ABC transport system permease protein